MVEVALELIFLTSLMRKLKLNKVEQHRPAVAGRLVYVGHQWTRHLAHGIP